MTTTAVANRLVELCREGKFEDVFKELYSEEIVSIEPENGPWGTVKGFEGIAKKAKEWESMVETVHSSEVSDPIVADNFFSCTMKTKVTLKGSPEIVNMDEICVYKVENGKVVVEQFFYTPLPQFV